MKTHVTNWLRQSICYCHLPQKNRCSPVKNTFVNTPHIHTRAHAFLCLLYSNAHFHKYMINIAFLANNTKLKYISLALINEKCCAAFSMLAYIAAAHLMISFNLTGNNICSKRFPRDSDKIHFRIFASVLCSIYHFCVLNVGNCMDVTN